MYYLFGHTVHSHPILAIIGTALVHHNRDRHDSSPPHTSPEHGKSLAFAVGAATGSSRLVRMEPPPRLLRHTHTLTTVPPELALMGKIAVVALERTGARRC